MAKKKVAKEASASAKQHRDALGATEYQLGPQDDGAIVMRVENDFDLMILRKALEKQQKNAGAAVGTVSALADGEDPFIEATQRSLERLLRVVNTSRAPANQIKGTPIGDAIREADRTAETQTARGNGGTWAAAIPTPRPSANDVVAFPDKSIKDIVEALGFKGDGLNGDESENQLQALADQGKLTGAFEVVCQNHEGPVRVVLHDEANGRTRIWRVQGADYSASDTPAPAPVGNLASTVQSTVAKATGRKKVAVARSGRIPKKKR